MTPAEKATWQAIWTYIQARRKAAGFPPDNFKPRSKPMSEEHIERLVEMAQPWRQTIHDGDKEAIKWAVSQLANAGMQVVALRQELREARQEIREGWDRELEAGS